MDLSSGFSTILQVIFINVVLSGDNAIVVGMAAAGAPAAIRQKVILFGIVGAVVLRVLLSLLAVQFLQIVGLLFAGGVLLLWVCWKLFREIRESAAEHAGTATLSGYGEEEVVVESGKGLGEAMWQIVVADVSMSLDNVLAVAGAAREHPWIMAGGLVLSVALMGIAATIIARLLDRHRWLAWAGLIVIVYVALRMIWDGGWEIGEAVLAIQALTNAVAA
ncbi:MAG: YjbE family putative metal transport protein [Propylenella sp.]